MPDHDLPFNVYHFLIVSAARVLSMDGWMIMNAVAIDNESRPDILLCVPEFLGKRLIPRSFVLRLAAWHAC